MEKTLGERIRNGRISRNIKQEELARLINVSSGRIISNWENNVAQPDTEKLVKLCDVLNLTAAYILGHDEGSFSALSHSEQKLVSTYRAMDVHGRDMIDTVAKKELERMHGSNISYGSKILRPYYPMSASAGTGQNIDNMEPEEIAVELNTVTRECDYIVPVSGDSMEPLYYDGDKVGVQKTDTLAIGEIGIFILNGESYIKRYEGDCLVSVNTKYSPIKLRSNDSFFISGRVLGNIE